MPTIDLAPLPPKEAIDAFKRKGFRIGFAWQDIWQEEHSRAFTVAKAMSLDLLIDIREAVDRALQSGTTLQQFRKELTPVLQQRGWWGKQLMTDPDSGETKVVQLGSPRRLKIIYDVNLRMSHAAGRWTHIEETKKTRPYLRYVHHSIKDPRPEHKAWHNLVLPVDDAFWRTHFPPNGWGCKCTAQSLSERDLKRMGLSVGTRPPIQMVPWRNPRTGQIVRVPEGIDPGFGYNVGLSALARSRELLEEKLKAAPPDIAREFRKEIE